MEELKIAIDIGYGFTKVTTGEQTFKFSTAVYIAKTEMVSGKKDYYDFNEKKYIVGKAAISNSIPTTDYSFIYKYSPLLICEALRLAKIDSSVTSFQLNTGLSLYDLDKAPEFDATCVNRREEFRKRISSFVINDIHYTPTVKLFAQGQGAWYNFCEENGYLTDGIETLIDIGYRTNDIIIIEDGMPNRSSSNADDKGVGMVVDELKMQIDRKYDLSCTTQEITKVLLSKTVIEFGREKDLTILIDDIIDSYIDTLFSSLKAKFGTILKKSTRVIITGGGAYLLEDHKDRFPPNIVFSKNKEYEFENVKGYFNA